MERGVTGFSKGLQEVSRSSGRNGEREKKERWEEGRERIRIGKGTKNRDLEIRSRKGEKR